MKFEPVPDDFIRPEMFITVHDKTPSNRVFVSVCNNFLIIKVHPLALFAILQLTSLATNV